MNMRTLLLLIAVAALTLLAGLWFADRRQPAETVSVDEALFPDLLEQVNEVQALQVQRAGDQPGLRLERRGDAWVVADRGGYPAQLSKVRETLLGLARSRLLEAKTRNPDLYSRLGVEAIEGTAEARGALLTLEMADQSRSVIIGNYDGQSDLGTFVRRPDEAQSWLASGTLTLDLGVSAWLQRDLLDISSNRLRAVHIEHPDGELISVAKEERSDANFRIVNIPEGREPASAFVANALASVLANLRLDDVMPASEAFLDPDQAITVRYETFDGLVVSLQAWPMEDNQQISLRAQHDDVGAAQGIDAEHAEQRHSFAEQRAGLEADLAAIDEGEDDLAESLCQSLAELIEAEADFEEGVVEDRATRLQALSDEVDAINAVTEGWVFTVPAFKFQNIDKRMDSLLQPLESEDN